jgi:hypothetical protein
MINDKDHFGGMRNRMTKKSMIVFAGMEDFLAR